MYTGIVGEWKRRMKQVGGRVTKFGNRAPNGAGGVRHVPRGRARGSAQPTEGAGRRNGECGLSVQQAALVKQVEELGEQLEDQKASWAGACVHAAVPCCGG